MHKIACVFSFRESDWVSCQKIVFNLHKAYEGVTDVQIQNFDYGPESVWGLKLLEMVKDIENYGPETIVILDHKPHPYHFLKILLKQYEKKLKPRIVFHVFGDFTLYYKDWFDLGKLLKDFPVEFIVASDRQKILIDQFLTEPSTSRVCPFPVRTDDFYFDPAERGKQRKEWGRKDTDIVFTFTGRISRQKRTHLLLRAFDEALRTVNSKNCHLYIYGQPDHVGDNFLGVWENENEYFRKIHRIYMELPESTRSRIHLMGNVPNSELRAVYAGADYLVNLSVHNDEDFGMSVAEAQMTGLPSILTDWGGLASFGHEAYPEATKFIKVVLGMRSKVISKEETVEALIHAMKTPVNFDRKKLVSLAREKFSVEAGTQYLSRILGEVAPTFNSFSEFHTAITKRMEFGKPVYMTKELKIHPIYRKLYSSYVRNP